MISITIEELVKIVNGTPVGINDLSKKIDSITIDSRKIEANSLFIAIKGEHFDGHEFVKQALNSGAIVTLVEQKIDTQLPHIIVKNTHQALGQIATSLRMKSKAKVVALTGSSGKTSVKEMTASILQLCGKTLYTQGNFNNDIGVPLTLFRLSLDDKFAVIELGANHIGEIAYTTKIVKPQSALINNIAQAHIEGFGSLAGVAQAKSEIFEGLTDNGTAIINLDSCDKTWLSHLKNKKVCTFSIIDNNADYFADNIEYGVNTQFIMHTPIGKIDISLPLLGIHNVSNALAAAALAISVGATLNDIQKGLSLLQPVKGRLYPIKLNSNQTILDDSYNANGGSMKAAIHVLAQQKGYRVLVVGDMVELGDESEIIHQQIGEEAAKVKLDCVISVGHNSALISEYSGVGHHFYDKAQALECIKQVLADHEVTTLLFKGSRSSKMEELIEPFLEKQD
ncbi:UDP-N-acetylmuramoyl-tripeptide--D-alanyl-D-alanine ligase [Orbaceae bacterium ac157xtp]